jgi:hypothetical protein
MGKIVHDHSLTFLFINRPSYSSTTKMGKELDTPITETRVDLAEPDVLHHSGGELERNFRFLDALGMAFAMLNSWTAMAAS